MPKQVIEHRIDFAIASEDRGEVRQTLVRQWLQEEPGTPDTTHAYRYDVERLRDGGSIYLTRPTRLNKGMDFVIYCENFLKWKNGRDKPPRHRDLIGETLSICGRSAEESLELRRALDQVWRCHPPERAQAGLQLLRDDARAERVLKLAKWMFIEQDLTYWTESGRWMLRGGLEDQVGPLG